MAGAVRLNLAAILLQLATSGDAARCAGLVSTASRSLEIRRAVLEQLPNGRTACRVNAIARPRRAARIGIEVWLPGRRDWSGRYYQMGNGGFAGWIHSPTLAAAAARGDAAAATDTGHVGDGLYAGWADGRPDLVLDYAHRSIGVTAGVARLLVNRYYGRAPRRRYFMGCSYGGRQALVAAARWPSDWDGVIAGVPAYSWTETLTDFARIARVVGPAGVRSDRAVAAVEAAGYPLAWADPAEWQRWIFQSDPTVPSQRRLAIEAFRHLFGAGRVWTPEAFRPTRDAAPLRVRRAFAIGDLRPFLRRGGKVLSYFGLADAVLPPTSADAHWRSLTAGMGGEAALKPSYRLFLIPGMAHCQGGAAPHAFGQSLAAPSLRDDPSHDVRSALERWVERGTAPDRLIAVAPMAQSTPSLTLIPYSIDRNDAADR